MRKLRDFAESRCQAVKRLRDEGLIKDPNVARAMEKVPREEFLSEEAKSYAYVDAPIPIGYGQTTSALHMTALFCEYGEIRLGKRVLEVGAGCGYMSCVYAEVVAAAEQANHLWGHVWAAEIVAELAEAGRKNVERLGYADRVTFIHADASEGLATSSPYDLIIVASAAPEIPTEMTNQLTTNGVLLIPLGSTYSYQELIRIRKRSNGSLSRENLGGVAFVPMTGKHGWQD
ncbi:MAG TPA: protein-L-isoaspartate O-methyltransferase [Terriglobales bacterium]|nr:protein-L-isoaspartate O-methyltransferase [Terriglobales bacterium]